MSWTITLPAVYHIVLKAATEIELLTFFGVVVAVFIGNYAYATSKYCFRQIICRFFPALLIYPVINYLTQSGMWPPPDPAKQR